MSSKTASGTPHEESRDQAERETGERPLMSCSLCRHARGNEAARAWVPQTKSQNVASSRARVRAVRVCAYTQYRRDSTTHVTVTALLKLKRCMGLGTSSLMVIVMRARRTLAYPATRRTQNAPRRHTGSVAQVSRAGPTR